MTPTKKPTAEVPPEPPATNGTRFFGWMRSLDIQRGPGWLGGVAEGISARLGIDPLIVRGIIVVVALLGGPALIVYAAAWLLLPDTSGKIHLEQLAKGRVESPAAGIGVMVLLAMLPIAQGFWFTSSVFSGEGEWLPLVSSVVWTAAVLAVIVLFVVWIVGQVKLPTAPPKSTGSPEVDFASWRAQQAATKAETDAFRSRDAAERAEVRREEQKLASAESVRQRALRAEARRRTRSHPLFTFLAIGLALVAGGVTTLGVGRGDLNGQSLVAGLAVAVTVLGIGTIINGVMGKRAGGAAGLATLLIVPLVYFVVPDLPNLQLFAAGTITPKDSTSSVTDEYIVAGGDVVLDLRDYYPSPGPDEANSLKDSVKLVVGSGNVEVQLPIYEYGTITVHTTSGEVTKYVKMYDDKHRLESAGSEVTINYGPRTSAFMTKSQRVLSVEIYVGDGDVTIVESELTQEFTS